MVQRYIEKKTRETLAAQWFPDKMLVKGGDFQPTIVCKKGNWYLRCSTGYDMLLTPGCYISYEGHILEYEVWTEEAFNREYLLAPEIHENGKTVV